MRTASIKRTTKETDITLTLNLDGSGNSTIDSGVGFLDHMLTAFAFHSSIDLTITCRGDLYIDDHHSVEDIGLVLGQALIKALGTKQGINRYGHSYVPMDETLARAVIDFSGRPAFVYLVNLKRETLGSLATENVKEFFKSVAAEAKMNLHLETLYGENDHHQVEALFKAFGRAVKEGAAITSDRLPSTKGAL